MRICVFHEVLANELIKGLAPLYPQIEFVAVTSVKTDPPDLETYDALIARGFPAGMLSRMPRLKWLQLTGVGYDHVSAGLPRPGLLLSTGGSVPAKAVAEFAMTGALALAKRFPLLIKNQQTKTWQSPAPRTLRVGEANMVLLGMGNIGREIELRAKAFGMNVIPVTRSGEYKPADLPDLAAKADYLVAAVPGDTSTQNLVSSEIIARLPSDGIVINVSRHSVVDMAALTKALNEDRLAGALVDTFEREPLPANEPYWEAKNLILTPHCAFSYPDHTRDLVRLMSDNIARFLRGETLLNSKPL